MHILLTNDDGIDAEGLRSLYAALKSEYEDVTVVAPSGQRSAVGHGVSFHKSFAVEEADIGYALDGTPADCVKWAILTLKRPIDLVISGINRGANMGVDVHYSGTVSAAMEAVIYSVPAVAFSCYCKAFRDSAYLSQLSLGIVRALVQNPLPKRRMLNVNYPNLVHGDRAEYVCAPLGFQFNDEIMQKLDGPLYAYDGYYGVRSPGNGSDVDQVLAGRICLTPLTWDMTAEDCFSQTETIKKMQTEQ